VTNNFLEPIAGRVRLNSTTSGLKRQISIEIGAQEETISEANEQRQETGIGRLVD